MLRLGSNYLLHFYFSFFLILVLNVIPNANFETNSQRIIFNTIALNINYNTIQQFHVKFYYLIKFLKLYR